MLGILTVGKTNSGRSAIAARRKEAAPSCRVLRTQERSARKGTRAAGQGSVKMGFMGAIFILTIVVIILGAFYLYQVNDLATKGYDIKEIENEIQGLKKTNEMNKIKEVELKSMYNLEKATENLDMVSARDITYLEIGGPVAMK